jgi:hypothetical protein
MGIIPMFLKLFGCNGSLLHNILEQVDLESAGFTKNKLASKIYNLIGTNLTKCILKADGCGYDQ